MACERKRQAEKDEVSQERRLKCFDDDDIDEFEDDTECKELGHGYKRNNTSASTSWALNAFDQWRREQNAQKDPEDEECPELLTMRKPGEMSEWLGRFIMEARRQDGKPYPPRTLHQLLLGIQRRLRTLEQWRGVNLFDNPDFSALQNACDSHFRQLQCDGAVSEPKATPILTAEDEDKLWSTGVINTITPEGLSNAVFFYNGRNFCMRGGQEHRDLKFSQLKRKMENVNGVHRVYYEYTKHGSHTRVGGWKQLKVQNTVVTQYRDANAGPRCHVDILDLYFRKVSKEAIEADTFYLLPVYRYRSDPLQPWFTKQPMGRNKLANMMKIMSVRAGLSKIYTNHSLRAFGASKLYQEGVPEKVIQEHTGYRSLEALRRYEVVSNNQEEMSVAMNVPQTSASKPTQLVEHPPMVAQIASQPQPHVSGLLSRKSVIRISVIRTHDQFTEHGPTAP